VELKRGKGDLVGDDHETAARNSDRSYLPLEMVQGARAAGDGLMRRPGGSGRRGERRPWRSRAGVLGSARVASRCCYANGQSVMETAECRLQPAGETKEKGRGWAGPYIKLQKCMLSSQLTHMAMCCKTFGFPKKKIVINKVVGFSKRNGHNLFFFCTIFW
jgi:hypothetical protein